MYLKNLDFLKFFFLLIIIMSHIITPWGFLGNLYPELFPPPAVSGVDYSYCSRITIIFFSFSSFLMVYIFRNKRKLSFLEYMKKRYLQFLPLLLLDIVFVIILIKLNLSDINNLFLSFHNLLLLDTNCLLRTSGYNGVIWFLYYLFWFSCGLYWLMLNFARKYVSFIVFVFSLISFILKLNFYNTFLFPNYEGLIYCFTCISGMGIGYFIGNWYVDKENNKSNNLSLNIKQFIFFSVIEILLFLYLIRSCFISIPRSDLFFYLSIIFIFILFLNKKGLISKITDSKISGSLGQYVFTLYITHFFVLYNLIPVWIKYKDFVHSYTLITVILAVFCCIIFSIFIYHIFMKPVSNYLRKFY